MGLSCRTKTLFTPIVWRHFELGNSAFILFHYRSPPHHVTQDYDLFLVFSWLTGLFWASLRYLSICWVTMFPAVTVTTHCHRSNSVDLLIVLSIKSTDDKSRASRFHFLCQDVIVWVCGIYGLTVTNIFAIFINLMRQYWSLKTTDIMACICFNHCTNGTALGGWK